MDAKVIALIAGFGSVAGLVLIGMAATAGLLSDVYAQLAISNLLTLGASVGITAAVVKKPADTIVNSTTVTTETTKPPESTG